MKIEFTELGRHEAWLRLSSIVKAGDKHIQLERKLTSELIKNWRESYNDVLKELFKQLPSELSSKAAEIITQRLAEALGPSFGSSEKVRGELRKYITSAYENGKSDFATDTKLNLSDIRAIDVLTKHNCYWLGEHYGKHIGGKIAELTQDTIRDGLGRDELAKELREALGGKVGGYKYWDVASSAALVRSRSFGCISGMVEAGIVEYEILAMGDERMCPICGEMHGKTFNVAETQKVIDGVLDISNPEKFKEAMPWHTEPPAGVSKDKLLADGMSIPPFHGRCRCTLIMSENEPEARLKSLYEQDTQYRHEYEDLQRQIEDAVTNKDIDKYNSLSKRQSEVLEKWKAISEDVRAAKIEAAQRGIMFASRLTEKLDETHIKKIISALEAAPEDIRIIWNMYEDQMKIIDIHTKDAYYSFADGGIRFSLFKDTIDTKGAPQYSVLFHELGHLIDNKSVGFGRFSYSNSYVLLDALKGEVEEYVKARQKKLEAEAVASGRSKKDVKKKDAYQSVAKEIKKLPLGSSMAVSDLFSGVTLNKAKDSWVHATKYWKSDPKLVCTEFFAQVFSDMIVNPAGLKMTKRYVPKSYAICEKMISDMAKKK